MTLRISHRIICVVVTPHASWPRGMYWSVGFFLHDPWVSRCFLIVWALVFKLPFPFVSSLFSISLLIAPSLFFSACSCDYSNFVRAILPIALHLFEVCFSFSFPSISFFFFFVICCKFLIFPFSFLRCDCLCFLAFGILVFISFFYVFPMCPWLVVLRLG